MGAMVFEAFGTGRCLNCGFFAKRVLGENDFVCYEATASDRTSGNPVDYRGIKTTVPLCFRRKTDYHWDIYNGTGNTERLLEAIKQDRKCPAWYPWTEFLSPKEHLEELNMLQLEQRREEFEQRMERERKEFEQRMENDRKSFELRLDESNKLERKKTDRIMIWLTIAGIIFALAQVAAGIMGITTDSWILKFFR